VVTGELGNDGEAPFFFWKEERLAWRAGCLFERRDGGWDERVKVEEVDVFFSKIGDLEGCVYGFGDGWAGGECLAFPD
jgi:hypothetical protein